MLGRVLVAPTRALRAQTFAFRSFSSCAARFESLPTKEQVATPYKAGGEFVRPKVEGSAIVSNVETPVAKPSNPQSLEEYGTDQAPNRAGVWSESQRPKSDAMKGPRFEQMDPRFQPQTLSAMELISNQPIHFTNKRVVSCDGGM